MSHQCAECGEVHDELPRYFMYRAPETSNGRVLEVQHDRKSMCRFGEIQFFVHCEIELPLVGGNEDPLGFICWVAVERQDYERLLHFRENEGSEPDYSDWVNGRLANPVPCIPDSHGAEVKFAVLKGDPTPYIKWVAPHTALAACVESGASMAFWHDVASLW